MGTAIGRAVGTCAGSGRALSGIAGIRFVSFWVLVLGLWGVMVRVHGRVGEWVRARLVKWLWDGGAYQWRFAFQVRWVLDPFLEVSFAF